MSSYDSAGNLLVNIAVGGGGGGAVNIADPTTPANKAVIDSAGRLIVIDQRRTDTVYAQTQTGISVNGDTGDIAVGPYSELAIDINLTALTGTSIQFRVQRKDAFGNYTQSASNVALTATGFSSFSIGTGMASNASFGDIIKVVWICSAVTSATFTVSVKAK